MGSDDGEIGTVKDVVQASSGCEGYMLVPQGLVFKSDMYIPLNAVTRRSGRSVFINIPKLVVGKMPWNTAPTDEDRVAKQGTPAGEVDNLYGSTTASVMKRD